MTKINTKIIGFLPEFFTSFAAAFAVAVLMTTNGDENLFYHSLTLGMAIIAGSGLAYLLRSAGNRRHLAS